MDQSDAFITISCCFDGLKRAVQEVCLNEGIPEASQSIIREIERHEIKLIYENEKKENSGQTQELRTRLAEQFYRSERNIEYILYEDD